MITQIYEIQTKEEAQKCLDLKVDHIGSVVEDVSNWRQEGLFDMIRLVQRGGGRHSLIPLFEDQDIIFKTLEYYQPDIVHFCDKLTDDQGGEIDLQRFVDLQRDLKASFPNIEIMRTIPVPLPSFAGADFPTLNIAKGLEEVSDWFLIDTWVGKDSVNGFVGITGKVADWEISRKLVEQSKIPVVLAGGLSPENVREAIMKVRPAAVDSCTQTNAFDQDNKPVRFKKDFDKVKRFVERAQMC